MVGADSGAGVGPSVDGVAAVAGLLNFAFMAAICAATLAFLSASGSDDVEPNAAGGEADAGVMPGAAGRAGGGGGGAKDGAGGAAKLLMAMRRA